MSESTNCVINFHLEDKLYAGFMPLRLSRNEKGSFFFWLAKKRSGVNPLSVQQELLKTEKFSTHENNGNIYRKFLYLVLTKT